MDTAKLRKFAQQARRTLQAHVQAKLQLVLTPGSVARREQPGAIRQLEEAMAQVGEAQVGERVAYIWFNRLCALRFMDVNGYNRIGVVSPAVGQTQPELLAEAKAGHIDEELISTRSRQHIQALLEGRVPSPDAQGEAYRLLLVGLCNYWHQAMPFLFERIDDYTELLMPDNLLAHDSVLAQVRDAMSPEDCQDVEVIGWLYQFYISERKDEVMARRSAVPTEDIPAVTQLFTPHWIVRYLVENSLGRLWLLNRPNSKLRAHMPYYIEGEAETDFLKISKPEEIRVLDPAVGSGHMLTYAFDLLYYIYEEVGTESSEIAERIIANNLYGIEIDERAGELAAFALTMKARARQRRFFGRGIKPNICVLENIELSQRELDEYVEAVGRELCTQEVRAVLTQFEDAKTFGALVRPCLGGQAVTDIYCALQKKDLTSHLFLHSTHTKVIRSLEQAQFLDLRHSIVLANPPYMGGNAMTGSLKKFAKEKYPSSKADLFAMFIERGISLTVPRGLLAMVTMQGWMFLSSYEELRALITETKSIRNLIQIGYNSFPEMNSKVAQACAFIVKNGLDLSKGCYVNLNDTDQAGNKELIFLEKLKSNDIFLLASNKFKEIPGSPIAYWVSEALRGTFAYPKIAECFTTREGMATADNPRFLRVWSEVSLNRARFHCGSEQEAESSGGTWFPYNKGGAFRRWYGNNELLVEYAGGGRNIKENIDPATGRVRSHNYNGEFGFIEGLTWSALTSGPFSIRYSPPGFLFDSKGAKGFGKWNLETLAFLNSRVAQTYLQVLSPTLDYKVGDVIRIPWVKEAFSESVRNTAAECVDLARKDWDNFETSWDFKDQPWLRVGFRGPTLAASWENWEKHSTAAIRRMQEMETANNRLFSTAYGLDRELSPEVPESQVTLAGADIYRDTAAFVSYAIGCMMGRYSLDYSGLILANAGDSLREFVAKVGRRLDQLTFAPDRDGVIPILDGEWFEDDIVARTRDFLRATFGEATLQENIRFIEDSLGKDLRKYFLTDFYKDHVKTYKKRPIYWLFSSPKGSFNALIYMHRYRSDMVSVVLNKYLRDYRNKLAAHQSQLQAISVGAGSTQVAKTRALKEIEQIRKVLIELDEYEHDVLFPLATRKIEIDLDDGVKVNYLKFGSALKKIPGLEAPSDE